MNGSDVRAARELIGWKRPQLADFLGLTVAQVARIELKGPHTDEEEFLLPILQKAGVLPASDVVETLDESTDGLPDPPTSEKALDDFDTGKLVLTEWEGVKRGQIVRLDGPNGTRHKFGCFVKTPAQEFVSMFSLKNGGERTVSPDRVWGPKGRIITP